MNLFRGEPFEISDQTGSSSRSRVDAFTESESYSLKNSFKFANFLTVTNSYQKAISRREQVGTESSRGESVSFPNLSTGLGQLERLPLIKWLFTNASAKTGYAAKHDVSYIGEAKNTDNVTKGFSPLLSFTGNMKKGIRFTLVMDQSESQSKPTSSRNTTTIRKSASQRMSFDYTFRSPNGIPLPFLRGIRLKSQMTVSLQITRRNNENITIQSGSAAPTVGQSSEFSISPRANYSFSSRVKGGLSAQWTDSSDDTGGTKRVSHIRELGIWAEFYF